jgi:hypothetical protein
MRSATWCTSGSCRASGMTASGLSLCSTGSRWGSDCHKDFNDDAIRQDLDARGATAVMPPKANRTRQIACDFAVYRWRHLVEMV